MLALNRSLLNREYIVVNVLKALDLTQTLHSLPQPTCPTQGSHSVPSVLSEL
jgi:hypothetical protein